MRSQSRPARRARSKRRCQVAALSSPRVTSGGHGNPVTVSAGSNITRLALPRSRAHRPWGIQFLALGDALHVSRHACLGYLSGRIQAALHRGTWPPDTSARSLRHRMAATATTALGGPSSNAVSRPSAATTSPRAANDPQPRGAPPVHTSCPQPAAPTAPNTNCYRHDISGVAPAPSAAAPKTTGGAGNPRS
jgi:hypothetical protein